MLELTNPNTDRDEIEQAQKIFHEYSRHQLALAISKMMAQRLVHPDLVAINLDQCKCVPVRVFLNPQPNTERSTNGKTERDIES